MNILLVHADKFPWATFNRAEALKKEWSEDFVEIVDRWHLPDEEYDVIHFLFSGGLSKCKDYILKRKNVFTSLASYRTLEARWDDLESLTQIYQHSVMCVAQNPDLEMRYKKLFHKDNVVYIPNGVNEQRFKREFMVGFVGMDNGHKGLDMIKQACQELGLKLKIADGNLNHEEVRDFYKEIDCLALASISEGCNNPTLEMLAMNKPVISTDVGIAKELEGVHLIERNVESIKRMLRHLSPRIGILEKYTWKIIAKQYKDLYVRHTGL